MAGLGPRHFYSRRTLSNARIHRNDRDRSLATILVSFLLTITCIYVYFLIRWYNRAFTKTSLTISEKRSNVSLGISRSTSTCQFRKYPPHRYFQRKKRPLPSFLTETNYIYGEFPSVLPTSQKFTRTQKLCVDQSGWYDQQTTTSLPFADGTNPSLLRLRDNAQLDLHHKVGWSDDAYYLATICMTNSQCAWKDTPQQMQDFKISTQTEPSTVRTVLLVLNQAFEVLEEATMETLVDAKFGRKVKPSKPPTNQLFALDDARLFTHQQELWVSYREGPNFGYDKQVLNRVHLERKGGRLYATLRASEVETLCCGRNMALLDNVLTHELQALTWVDPITVVNVAFRNASPLAHRNRQRRLSLDDRRQYHSYLTINSSQLHNNVTSTNRRLAETKDNSQFHGTNGFMVHLPRTREYLGIGHFHRPSGRDANEHARFGHHYTHAFFTIPDQPPYRLKRLSHELLLPSFAYPDDAEVIQFWSGLERVDDQTLALAYGINDCEGGATYIDMEIVEGMLRDVPAGKEVADFMDIPKIGD